MPDDRWTVLEGDCVEVMRSLPEASVDAVVCDPPYNLTFMGKPWDCHDGQEDAGFAYWLAGLIDGEGHFAIKAHTRGSHAPAFTIKMRADEEGTLRLIERTLRIGVVSHEKRSGNPMVKWTVQDKAGCQRLVDLLDKYPLRAKKRLDYATWREAVCEWTSRPRGNRWHGAASNARMAHLRERLMTTRAYVEPAWSGHEFQDWCRLWGREALRVLKPGGHLLAFGGSRTSHRLVAGLEDAGFEIRDTIMYLYGSGFPKSLDVSKAIDKAAGAERERVPATGGLHAHRNLNDDGWKNIDADEPLQDSPTPATPEAEQWSGWGTALKPAHEPIVLARKPLAGTVAANVLEYGTGALNVDGCRVGAEGGTAGATAGATQADTAGTALAGSVDGSLNGKAGQPVDGLGRWPANVVLDEQAARMLDEQTADLNGAGNLGGTPRHGMGYHGSDAVQSMAPSYGDSGGASRFFKVVRHTPEGDSIDPCATASGAADPSSPPSRPGASAPGGAPTSEPPAATPSSGCPAPSTSATPRPSEPSGESATPPTPSTEPASSPELPPDALTPSPNPASPAAPPTPTGTTTTTTSPSASGGSAVGATSESTPPSAAHGELASPSGSRFRYCAKADTAEREAGITGPTTEQRAAYSSGLNGERPHTREGYEYEPPARRNVHPTVKPIDLMRWLVRLVTPPGGLVLDPFTGSGTTGAAAMLEGVRFLGIERDPDYLPLARARIGFWSEQPLGIEVDKALEGERRRQAVAETGQVDLFAPLG